MSYYNTMNITWQGCSADMPYPSDRAHPNFPDLLRGYKRYDIMGNGRSRQEVRK